MPDSPTPPPQRQSVLIETRRRKMAQTQHAYVRGSTEKFYEWMAAADHVAMPSGPPVWICGDCHTGNLGPISSAEGRVTVGIRDLDQTVIGNPAHDLIRLGLSLATSARSSNLSGITVATMLEQMIDGYGDAFGDGVATGDMPRPAGVARSLRLARNRSWEHLARERGVDGRSKIGLGGSFWPLANEERQAIETLAGSEPLRALVTSLHSRDDDAQVRFVDAAFWRKGCSSLGLLRYALLVRIKRQRRRAEQICLLDIKQATQALAPRHDAAAMPRDNGQRVVTGARHLTPSLGDRMLAERLLGHAVVVRELRPQDLKLELDALGCNEAVLVARYLAGIVGQAHARQLDAADKQRWVQELARGRSKTLDAPSWLWKHIVGLVMAHEAAYLEHCRRFGASAAAA